MIKFRSYVNIHLCANTPEELDRWTRTFQVVAGNNFRFAGSGDWDEDGVVASEPNTVIQVWGPDQDLLSRLLATAQEYQADARQNGVSLVAQGPGGWFAGIALAERQADGSVTVDPAEWADARAELEAVLFQAVGVGG